MNNTTHLLVDDAASQLSDGAKVDGSKSDCAGAYVPCQRMCEGFGGLLLEASNHFGGVKWALNISDDERGEKNEIVASDFPGKQKMKHRAVLGKADEYLQIGGSHEMEYFGRIRTEFVLFHRRHRLASQYRDLAVGHWKRAGGDFACYHSTQNANYEAQCGIRECYEHYLPRS